MRLGSAAATTSHTHCSRLSLSAPGPLCTAAHSILLSSALVQCFGPLNTCCGQKVANEVVRVLAAEDWSAELVYQEPGHKGPSQSTQGCGFPHKCLHEVLIDTRDCGREG